ncbi:DUF3301 domain-containing protein [Ectothiorhodospiraceae bacterium 2226]|nr:DUF3301 domain-containing protein [Ectothiorhodospiraceae bacterium 2226]
MSTAYWWLLACAGAVAWWVSAMRLHERAGYFGARACDRHRVQLLDQTVHLRKLGLARDDAGRMRVRRYYAFEFTTTGADRRGGVIVMLGPRLEYVHLELPEGAVLGVEEEG